MTTPSAAPGEAPVAVVTGGSTGIGYAICQALLATGHRVAFFSQDGDRVAAAAAALAGEYGDGMVFADTIDLRDESAVRDFFARVAKKWSPVGVLVSNAGFSPKRPGGRTPLAEIDPAEWADVLRVNLTGAFLCCSAVLPAMAERKSGRIVLIGSVAGRTMPRIAGASYVASKSALAGLMRSIVSEYSRFGISANLVCPGRILTDMTGAPDSPVNRAALERIPIGRLGQPEDIARMVAFLIQPGSDFVNGAIIDVNGGEFTPT